MSAHKDAEILMQKFMDFKDPESKKIYGDIEEIDDEVEQTYHRFKNLERIAHPPHDHHYLIRKRFSLNKAFPKSAFRRRIQREWSLLEEYLPNSSIFVRAYESSIDLMRAAVMGPRGTPYHHCLFFFDIYFPGSYPNKAPKFHYRSYGLDLNPHLLGDGTVRLFLLEKKGPRSCFAPQTLQGNVGGVGEERWNPKESNILNVFGAIQNLILSLCRNPPEKYGVERVFAVTCEKMIRVLSNPPMDFEDFVVGHFRKRAHWVLMKFKENGYESEDMVDLFANLMKAFEGTGAYCQHHLDFLPSRNHQQQQQEEEEENGDVDMH